jgi:predicted nucleotidyltransferase
MCHLINSTAHQSKIIIKLKYFVISSLKIYIYINKVMRKRSMTALNQIIKVLRENKLMLRQKYSVKNLALFGSFVRGDNSEQSDIDILAEFESPPGLEFVDLVDELEKLLKNKVDLVSRRAVKERFMEHIEKELIYV